MTNVTLVMGTYNAEEFLAETIDSVLRQDLEDFEFLIVNDGSTDRTRDILEDYAERDERITLIHQENKGHAHALNRGLAEAKGKYIARIDADDLCLPHRLRLQAAELDRNPQAMLVTGGIEIIGTDGEHQITEYTLLKDRDIRRAFWLGTPLYHPSIMFRRDAVLELGGYDTTPATYNIEDYDLYLRLCPHGEIVALPKVLIRYRVHPTSISVTTKSDQQALIDALRDKRWADALPPVIGPRQLRSWCRDYADPQALGCSPRFCAGMQRRVRRENVEMGLEFLRRKHWLRGIRQLLSVMLSGPAGCGAMWSRFCGLARHKWNAPRA